MPRILAIAIIAALSACTAAETPKVTASEQPAAKIAGDEAPTTCIPAAKFAAANRASGWRVVEMTSAQTKLLHDDYIREGAPRFATDQAWTATRKDEMVVAFANAGCMVDAQPVNPEGIMKLLGQEM